MSGRPYLTLLNNAAVAALNIVGCLILIPRYGHDRRGLLDHRLASRS